MTQIQKKVKELYHEGCELKVVVSFNFDNSLLARALGREDKYTYNLMGFNDNGVLIGRVGHLQLIEWRYVSDVY